MFAGQGYILILQDVRGRFESEGDYLVSAADRKDGYDTVEWISKQPWSNGKVGTFGCSYPGENQFQLAAMRHPYHTVVLPTAAGGVNRYFGLYQGGAFELVTGFGWFMNNGSKYFLRPPEHATENFRARYGHLFSTRPERPEIDVDAVRTLPTIDLLKNAGGPPSDFEDFVSHGPGHPYWDKLGYIKKTDRFNVPGLHVNSWYDLGVKDTLQLFNLMRTNAESKLAADNQFVIISPTDHCQSERATENTIIGERDMGDARYDYWNTYLKWFDYWLKGDDNGITDIPKVQLYVMGKNEWRGEDEWPLARTRFTPYYLHSSGGANSLFGNGVLNTTRAQDEHADTFTYAPGYPVPSVGGPICCVGNPDATAGAYDQSEVELRNDVLVYTTPALKKGIEITGPIEAILFVSSDARDTDFTAKLVDVYPDGTAYNIQEGILRMRYREGYDKKLDMKADRVYEIRIDMQATSNYFHPGHKIRLEISSSNFPRFDRNLNTGGNNFDESEWVIAKNRVYHSKQYPSHILLPVIPAEAE